MTEYEAFLSAIIENPTDDVPRLVFADWLEEHGNSEQAEFIRIQCELAAMKPKGCRHMKNLGSLFGYPIVETGTECGKCQWCLLTEREQELLQAHKHEWLPSEVAEATIFGMATPEQVAAGLRWRRGFIAEVTLACQDWLAYREQLLRMAPLEKVTIIDWKENHDKYLWSNDFLSNPYGFDNQMPPFRWVYYDGNGALTFCRNKESA